MSESRYVTVGREELIAHLERRDQVILDVEARAKNARETAREHLRSSRVVDSSIAINFVAEYVVAAGQAQARAEAYELVLSLLRGEPL